MAAKYYAVKVGLKPGIYRSWDECKVLVHGYPGAVYKSFQTEAEAVNFMGGTPVMSHKNSSQAVTHKDSNQTITDKNKTQNTYKDSTNIVMPSETNNSSKPYAFVDGSFNAGTGVYGYGGFVIFNGEKYIVTGSGDEPDMASMRNVAGEVLGSIAAVEKAIELGIKEIDIYYDYMGIEMWATGAWKRNKKGTIAYYDFMQKIKSDIKVNFVKVKGHSGVDGNEEADILAKKAVNIL